MVAKEQSKKCSSVLTNLSIPVEHGLVAFLYIDYRANLSTRDMYIIGGIKHCWKVGGEYPFVASWVFVHYANLLISVSSVDMITSERNSWTISEIVCKIYTTI